jgi:renalase
VTDSPPVPGTAPSRVLVLGAGCAGLVAALDLVTAGFEVTVLDKGRAVGGRLATRRVGDAVFDHGAQFATFKHDDIADLVERWRDDGVLAPWFHGAPDAGADGDDGHPRFRGVPTMRTLAERLADRLPDVRTGRRVTRLCADATGWVAGVRTVDPPYDESTVTADALVCTAPLPQTLALLEAGGVALEAHLDAALRPVTYTPTLAVLAVPDGPTSLPNGGALRLEDGEVSWLGDVHAKGSSPQPGVVVHGSPEVSRALWTASDQEIADRLLAAARPHLGVEARSVYVQRWRYATPTGPAPGGDALTLASVAPAPVAFAGDAFAGGRVEGALRSGRAAAAALASLLR